MTGERFQWEDLGFGFSRDTFYGDVFFRPPAISDLWMEALTRGGGAAVVVSAIVFLRALARDGARSRWPGVALCSSAALVGAMRWFSGGDEISWERFPWLLTAVSLYCCTEALGPRRAAWPGWIRDGVLAAGLAFVFVADQVVAEVGNAVFALPWVTLLALVRWRISFRTPPHGLHRLRWEVIAGAHAAVFILPALMRVLFFPAAGGWETGLALIFGLLAVVLGGAAAVAALIEILSAREHSRREAAG